MTALARDAAAVGLGIAGLPVAVLASLGLSVYPRVAEAWEARRQRATLHPLPRPAVHALGRAA